jgi:hypothetical protein
MADFIDEMQKDAQERWKRELTPSEAAEKFALHNFETRIAHLKTLDGRPLPMSREGAQRHAIETALRRVHDRLRRVGR